MQKILNRFLLLFFVSLIILLSIRILSQANSQTFPVAVTNTESANQVELTQKQIETIIDNYIANNPQVIISSLEALQKQKAEEFEDKVKCLIEDKKEKKIDSETHSLSPFLGNKNGNINVTVFYDYNCPHCKKEATVIDEIIKDPNNKNVKILLKPYPILGENSMYLTQIALAVYKLYPSKFDAIHRALLVANQSPSNEEVDKILSANGINSEQIKNSIKDPDSFVSTTIKKIYDLAQSLKVISVPTFIVNGKVLTGELTKSSFQEIIKQ